MLVKLADQCTYLVVRAWKENPYRGLLFEEARCVWSCCRMPLCPLGTRCQHAIRISVNFGASVAEDVYAKAQGKENISHVAQSPNKYCMCKTNNLGLGSVNIYLIYVVWKKSYMLRCLNSVKEAKCCKIDLWPKLGYMFTPLVSDTVNIFIYFHTYIHTYRQFSWPCTLLSILSDMLYWMQFKPINSSYI